MAKMRKPSGDVMDQVVAEFQFNQEEEILFRALIGGMLEGLGESELRGFI